MGPPRSTSPSGQPLVRRQRDAPLRRRERAERDTPDRARAGPERLRPRRIGAAFGELNRRAERVGGADQRPHVPGVGDVPERKRHRTLGGPWQVHPPVDADDPRRVGCRRHLRQQTRVDVLTGDEQVDGIRGCRRDRVLALDEEQPELVAPPPLMQPADGASDALPRGAGPAKPPAAAVSQQAARHRLRRYLAAPRRAPRLQQPAALTDTCRYRNIL